MKIKITGSRTIDGTNKNLTISNLKKINVLFGKNATGKSSFLRALYQSDAENYHLVVPERGGTGMQYSSGMLDQENSDQQKKRARNKNFDSEYRNRAISRATGILTSVGYKTIHNVKADHVSGEELTNLFRVILPEFKVQFSGNAPFNLEIYREDNGKEEKITDTIQLSSGQAEALSLAADIITQAVFWQKSKKTLLIDEPDAHLHIDLENRFAIFVNEIVTKFDIQIIIATHSSGLIASLLSLTEDVGIVCFDKRSEKISAIQKDQAAIFTNLLSIELALAVVLNRKIVIVEGNDDFLVWNQAARSPNFEDIALIQANGGDILKYKKNAEKILETALDNPNKSGITILDGDNKGEFTNQESDILPCERLKCYSLENLLLTNELLAEMKDPIDLNDELEKLKNEGDLSEEEKAQVDQIIKDKKNTKISKNLIKKLHLHIDDHSSSRDWRILIGKRLGVGKPTGELANFLGTEIVNYLWQD
ncbi:AAA family ATPase [Candidatus Peregrinibacteria bacterium]|nr:AAA family ATPase [Candidatus Peregrinibacteria bacterium]